MKWNERWSLRQRKFTFKWSFHRLPRRTSNSLYTSEKPYLEFWEEGFNFHSSFSSSKVALFVSFTFSSGGIKFSIINVLRKRKRKSSALYSPSAFLLAKSLQLILETRAPYRFLDTSMLTGKWSIYGLSTMCDCELSAIGNVWLWAIRNRHVEKDASGAPLTWALPRKLLLSPLKRESLSAG